MKVIPVLRQRGLVATGLRITHEIDRSRAVPIGLLSVAVFFVMFLAYMQ